jgi:hypothetical protein
VRAGTWVALLLLLTGCAVHQVTQPSTACQEAKRVSDQYSDTAAGLKPTINDMSADYTDRQSASRGYQTNLRLAAQVILDNPVCFDTEARAVAREVLAAIPAQ